MAAAAGDDVSIRMLPSADDAAVEGGEVPPPRREGEGGEAATDADADVVVVVDDDDAADAANNPEKQLTRFVRAVVLGEWAGNAFGFLALAWATTVLLGGFSSSLNSQDFWFATFMIFAQSLRAFSDHYKLDSQYLFGTARALRWINSSFPRMLGRPQGNQMVLIMGLWFELIHRIVSYYYAAPLGFILQMALLILWSQRPQGPHKWQIRALTIIYLLWVPYVLFIEFPLAIPHYHSKLVPLLPLFIFYALRITIEAWAVLPLNLRPRGLANLTNTPCGRRLISMAKVTSVLWLAADEAIPLFLYVDPTLYYWHCLQLSIPITMLVLSLGSLQNRHAAADSPFGRWIDAILNILFLLRIVLSAYSALLIDLFLPDGSVAAIIGLSLVLVLVLLLIGNLQIPTAVAQIVLSSMRLRELLSNSHIVYIYSQQVRDRKPNPNMVRGLIVFYVLTLCQGALYTMAIFLALFSWLPKRWLIRRAKFGGKLGVKAIDLYYQHAYVSRIEGGVFGARSMMMSFADFAMDCLNSSTSPRDLRVAGLYVLHNILLERRSTNSSSTRELILRVTTGSGMAVPSTVIGMLAWAPDQVEEDGDAAIRLLAARVTAELASSLRISSIPGMLKPVSSLLNNLPQNSTTGPGPLPNQQQPLLTALSIVNGGTIDQLAQGSSNGVWRFWSWVCQFWQKMKHKYYYWSIPEEPDLLTQQDYSSLPVLGMVILEKLARDLDNCAQILKDDTANLISKTIGLIGLFATTSDNNENEQNNNNARLVSASLEFLRRLATTGERIGAELRQELYWNHPFLLTCLARVLEDDRSSSSSPPHELWEPAMDIIAKLALDSAAGPEIARNQVITARLLHVFLGRHGPNNQSLRQVSGEALANLSLWGIGKGILEEPRYDYGHEVINDLKNMLSDDEHRYVAASLLLDLCAYCRSANVNLLQSHPRASEHLSSALTTVIELIMAAEGKQLESLINLASEIGHVMPHVFVLELRSQTNGLVQKLVSTLHSKKVPNPEYPRMRRAIVKLVISILESCRCTGEKLMEEEEGMMELLMESLTKIEKSPSRVEEYRVFYGNIGVVPEDEPMSTLVDSAKLLLHQHITQSE